MSPTTCWTQCLNHDFTLALRSTVFPLGVHKACTLESKAIRYIPSCYYPDLIGVVTVGVATDAREYCMMLERNLAIPWPLPDVTWSSGQHKFNKSACLWRDGLTCYSDSIVKFALSGCLQINGLDNRNDVDKFLQDVKILITSHADCLGLLSVNKTKVTLEPLVTHCQTEEHQLAVSEHALSAQLLWRNSEEMFLWVGAISSYGLQQLLEMVTTWISLHGMGDSRVEMLWPVVNFCPAKFHDSDQCELQEAIGDLQLGATYDCKELIICKELWPRFSYSSENVILHSHKVFVVTPDKKKVEQQLCIQSPRQCSECYGLDLFVALPWKLLRLFPWCCALGVNLKSMGSRVTRNPWLPSVHYGLAVYGLDVLPVPWPPSMLVKITSKGADIRPIPWPSFGFCQGLKATASPGIKLYLNSRQQDKAWLLSQDQITGTLKWRAALTSYDIVIPLMRSELISQSNSQPSRVSYKGTNVELTSAGLKLPEGDGIVWLCNGEPKLEQVLLQSNGLISRTPETLMLKSVVMVTAKHQNSRVHTSQEVSFGAHCWLWSNSEKLLLWSEAISCNVLKLFSKILAAYISVHGMSSPRANMSWPQSDFGSMESQDSDQCGCDKQRSRHSESLHALNQVMIHVINYLIFWSAS